MLCFIAPESKNRALATLRTHTLRDARSVLRSLRLEPSAAADAPFAHLIASTGCKIHLILSSKSNVKTVIPQSNNVTYNQADDINDINPEKVFIHIDKILHA